MKTVSPLRSHRAFSLVEVVIALGLVTFCLLAVTGLLPVGLKSVKNANDEAAATNALTQIGSAIRNATTENGTRYSATGSYQDLEWDLGGSPGGTPKAFPDILIGLSGQSSATTTGLDARYRARVEIISPASATEPGHARVTI